MIDVDLLVIVLLAALAAYRLFRFCALDTLPLFARPRGWLVRRWGEDSWKTEGLTCPWCLGAWWSLVVVLALRLDHLLPSDALVLVAVWLAVSTLVGLIGSRLEG